jgi:hypothetical protein
MAKGHMCKGRGGSSQNSDRSIFKDLVPHAPPGKFLKFEARKCHFLRSEHCV